MDISAWNPTWRPLWLTKLGGESACSQDSLTGRSHVAYSQMIALIGDKDPTTRPLLDFPNAISKET